MQPQPFECGGGPRAALDTALGLTPDRPLPPPSLAQEAEEGRVEYKLRLDLADAERLQHLQTQLRWRLREGSGSCTYFLGVADNGFAAGLPRPAAVASLGALRGMAASPEGLVIRFNRAVDQQVLDGTVPTDGESPRDRIFDLLMRRLDALQPHRAGIVRFTKELPFHPVLTLVLGAGMERSMGWMLEAAGISSHGPAGVVRIKGLTVVWVYTLNAWMKDESTDLAATMAALDRALDRADQVARSLDRGAKAKPEPVAE